MSKHKAVSVGFDPGFPLAMAAILQGPPDDKYMAYQDEGHVTWVIEESYHEGWRATVKRIDTMLARVNHWLDQLGLWNGMNGLSERRFALVVEDYAYAARGNAQSKLYNLGFVLRELMEQVERMGLAECWVVGTGQLKKFMTGKGNSSTTNCCVEASNRWSVQFETDDEYMAYGLARMGLCLLGIEEPHNQKAAEAVEAVRTGVANTPLPQEEGTDE